MTGFECICEAIRIFEDSLKKREPGCPLPVRSVNDWARRTGYSVHHFARLFSAVTGVSPKEYLSGRILTEAARDLAESKTPLSQVAFQVGYPDYETFSRAFKRHFALSPRQIRSLRFIPDKAVPRLVPQKKTETLRLASTEPETLERGDFTLAGLPFYIGPETNSYHSQWATFLKVQGRIVARTQPETFYQFSSWIEGDAAGMSVLCGLETDSWAAQEPFFTIRRVPRAGYLRFVHVGDISAMGTTYQYIYGDWLAHHDVRPADSWEFQQYAEDGSRTEIWIPLAQ